MFSLVCTSAAGTKLTIISRKFCLADGNGNETDLWSEKMASSRGEIFSRTSKIFTACDEFDNVTVGDKIRYLFHFYHFLKILFFKIYNDFHNGKK